MTVRVLATRSDSCRCGHPIVLVTFATDVEDAIPIEVGRCSHCDGPEWGVARA